MSTGAKRRFRKRRLNERLAKQGNGKTIKKVKPSKRDKHNRAKLAGEENDGNTGQDTLTTKTIPEEHDNTTLPLGSAMSTIDRKDRSRNTGTPDASIQHTKHLSQAQGGAGQNDEERDHNTGQHPKKRKRTLSSTHPHGLMKRRSEGGETDTTTGKTEGEGQYMRLHAGLATTNPRTDRSRQAASKRKMRESEGKHENPRKRAV